jgi:tartrate dehydratase beta subunit/fumarate hydratase class I family protein
MPGVTTTLHRTKRIVETDFGGCKPGEFGPVIAQAVKVITASPPASVLALTNFENVRFDPSTVVEMQRFLSAVQPHLKANALVGITGMKKVVFGGIKPLYKIPVELFDGAAAARDWLVAR